MPWQVLAQDTEILAVHIVLLPTSQILILGGDQHDADLNHAGDVDHTRLFDCTSLTVSGAPSPDFDVFCCGHSTLMDGRILIAGGTARFPGVHDHHAIHFPGLRDAATFNPRSGQWTPAAAMNPEPGRATGGGRWYPSLVTLADGKVLTLAGHPQEDDTRHGNDSPEVYSPNPADAGTWRLISGSDPAHEMTYYPRAHVLPTGEVFFASPVGGRTQRLLSDPYRWTDLTGPVPDPFYDGWIPSSVLLPLLPEDGYRARVLVTNGTTPFVIDAGAPAPVWQPTNPRALPGAPVRQHASAVLLADGRVLVCGGVGNPGDDATGVRAAEIYDPRSGTWSVGDTATVVRNYHSVALLMPDGRVFTAGGNGGAQQSFPSPQVDTRELGIELYSPPYMAAARPSIGWAPADVGWGQYFHVQTSQADRIRRVALLRAGSSTHAWDGDQRFVGCTFAREGEWLHVKAPPTPAVAPPGAYLLVTINDAGVPSPGRFVRVSPPSRGSSALVQSGYGNKGNFEFLAPRAGGGLAFWWRDNDVAGLPWSPPQVVAPGAGRVESVPSVLQSNFDGNLEAAARIGDRLVFFWRAGGTWHGPAPFGAAGARGNPAMVQSRYGGRGNFELVVPVAGGGFGHYWRDNDAPGLPWGGPAVIGRPDGQVDAVALLQSNFGDPGNLEVVARYGTRLALWWRESGPPWQWSGPDFFFDGAAGVPSVVQSTFGARGNFELVTPLAAGGAAHLWRDNDPGGVWHVSPGVIGAGQQFAAASLIESNFGAPGPGGNLEVVLRTTGGRNLHYWRDNGPGAGWGGPSVALTADPPFV